ncbi:hypothetical protein AMAG_12498 [Allomyces macrogynus ATCC 38327]|uniref:Uncharacterized protein n=1 Tax=Allomyces macrogynus (strain ATCC 38327) TaxID=578462 RepID=A0A0L0SYY5_ALLM3|nr:hypothetical protein AMAG_12498 [Allomyces macrogynus ATCC 38327]|eukprot:KNE67773.1 hypothetical protein AMAG_12498 [Allomyces macrogynus ATCC 38327]
MSTSSPQQQPVAMAPLPPPPPRLASARSNARIGPARTQNPASHPPTHDAPSAAHDAGDKPVQRPVTARQVAHDNVVMSFDPYLDTSSLDESTQFSTDGTPSARPADRYHRSTGRAASPASSRTSRGRSEPPRSVRSTTAIHVASSEDSAAATALVALQALIEHCVAALEETCRTVVRLEHDLAAVRADLDAVKVASTVSPPPATEPAWPARLAALEARVEQLVHDVQAPRSPRAPRPRRASTATPLNADPLAPAPTTARAPHPLCRAVTAPAEDPLPPLPPPKLPVRNEGHAPLAFSPIWISDDDTLHTTPVASSSGPSGPAVWTVPAAAPAVRHVQRPGGVLSPTFGGADPFLAQIPSRTVSLQMPTSPSPPLVATPATRRAATYMAASGPGDEPLLASLSTFMPFLIHNERDSGSSNGSPNASRPTTAFTSTSLPPRTESSRSLSDRLKVRTASRIPLPGSPTARAGPSGHVQRAPTASTLSGGLPAPLARCTDLHRDASSLHLRLSMIAQGRYALDTPIPPPAVTSPPPPVPRVPFAATDPRASLAPPVPDPRTSAAISAAGPSPAGASYSVALTPSLPTPRATPVISHLEDVELLAVGPPAGSELDGTGCPDIPCIPKSVRRRPKPPRSPPAMGGARSRSRGPVPNGGGGGSPTGMGSVRSAAGSGSPRVAPAGCSGSPRPGAGAVSPRPAAAGSASAATGGSPRPRRFGGLHALMAGGGGHG